ncbi:MAG: hypothetical protein ACI9OJ_001843 [Myxococcota bacterium]|jgi:hypothetical protein
MLGSHAVSKSSEYICINCWAPFEAVADTSGKVTCPDCEYVQPASDDFLGGSKAEASAPPPPSDMDATMADMKAPWSGGSPSAPKPARSMEPISFDDLEELEALLTGDAEPQPTPKPKKPAPPRQSAKPKKAAKKGGATAPGKKGGSESAATPQAATPRTVPQSPTPESADESAPEAEAARDGENAGEILWRLKSDSGLTYSFYDSSALLRWHSGLGEQKHALLSNDSVSWKPVAEFTGFVEGGATPEEAFAKATASTPPPAEAPPSTSTTTTGQRENVAPAASPRRAATGTRKRPKSNTLERPRGPRGPSTTTTGERKAPPARSASVAPRGSQASAQIRPTEMAEVNTWSGRLAFMALGFAVGGGCVYFGMYLLGFYDLVFSF